MARGKHKHTAAYVANRKRWTSKNPRGTKRGGRAAKQRGKSKEVTRWVP